jgi:hypothetical protein
VFTQPVQEAAGDSAAHSLSADRLSGIVTEPPTTPLPGLMAANTASALSHGILSYTKMPLKPSAYKSE